jgi:alanine-synthesizing transaminase
MLSDRVPRDASPNAWAERLARLRVSGAALIDLTEANASRVGLGGPGPAGADALAEAASSRSYEPDPRGLQGAREAIRDYYASRGIAADPEALTLTASTSEAYAHLFRLLANPGDSVLVPAPSYPLFEPIAALENVAIRSWPLAFDGRWHFDALALEAALKDGARAVIVVQPNHPTGTCLDASGIGVLEALCERHGAAIIADEVFGDFAWDERTGGLPSLIGERRVPTFVLSGLSKVCGLPQMKLAWIWTGGPERSSTRALRSLEWIADLFLSVASPVQQALPALLSERGEFQRRVLDRIRQNRATLAAACARHPESEALPADGGWVAMLRLPARHSGEQWALECLDHGVIVHPGHFYDVEHEAFVVASLIVEPTEFAIGVGRLESALSAN